MEKQTKKIEEEDLERKRERERGTERERHPLTTAVCLFYAPECIQIMVNPKYQSDSQTSAMRS